MPSFVSGRPHRRKSEPDEPRVGEKPRPLEPLEETQARRERAELPAGLEDRDLERALKREGGGRAAAPLPTTTAPLHGRTSSKKKRARHSASPEVILSRELQPSLAADAGHEPLVEGRDQPACLGRVGSLKKQRLTTMAPSGAAPKSMPMAR